MPTLLIGWIAAVGACVGSFLTVVTSRVPIGGSIVCPPSACPGCGVHIPWYHNIPVVSWIALRGRCRHCRTTIPLRYPALELGVATVFAFVALLAPPLAVPVLLVTATGLIATATAWLMHRRFSREIVAWSGLLGGLVALATIVAGLATT